MAGTRSSARNAANPNSSPQSAKSTNGNKRKAESSPETAKTKRGKKSAPKQKTLEETLPDAGAAEPDKQDQNRPQDIEMKEAASGGEGADAQPDSTPMPDGANKKDAYFRPDGCWFWVDGEKYAEAVNGEKGTSKKTMNAGDSFKGKNREGEPMSDPEKALKDSRGGPGINVMDDSLKSANQGNGGDHEDIHEEPTEPAHHENGSKSDTQNGGAVEESKQRADAMPSNILEKGIIYFFTRGRVSVDEPESVQDLQRSYFVLRPLPSGAKLNDGAIPDAATSRLLALPKKVWPKSGADKFMVFVEQAKTSMQDLKENFFQGSEYSTKTTGTRQQHPVTPLGEGVYAITATGNTSESHLAYMLTIPREPGERQEDVGIRAKGSFVLSLKNPTVKGPANASLPQGPDWPKEFIDAFRGRGWMPAEPKHLDYANAQVLLIGEDIEKSHALDATSKDEKSSQKQTPKEAIEELEHEDELRVEHLKGDDAIFADLGISSKDYPSVATTW